MSPSLVTALTGIKSVQSVMHFPYTEVPEGGFTLLPFLCPFRYKPYNVVTNEQGVIQGVTTGYRKGITEGSLAKIARVRAFWEQAALLLGGSKVHFLMGDSDVYACSSIFPEAPSVPQIDGFEVVSNKEIWEKEKAVLELERICDTLYEKCAAPIQDVVAKERAEHLQVDGTMYHEDVPKVWKEKMIRRILSSYMLDGILMRRGVYGPNPIILGVEAMSTAIIQNAALSDKEKIPIIMLKP